MAEKKLSVDLLKMTGEKAGTVDLSESVFGVVDANIQCVHDAVVTEEANARQATAKTKKRHEVSGGGKKPWRQKGTGRARAGSIRSPLWVGGGTVFGPDGNQSYKLSQNKKAHLLALRTVLSQKVNNGLVIVDKIELKELSSKEFASILKNLKLDGKKVLYVTDGSDEKVIKAALNLAKVGIRAYSNVSVRDVLNSDALLMDEGTLEKLQGGLE